MSDFYTILTTIGLQKHNQCVLNGTKFLEPTTCSIAIGDGNGVSYDPTGNETALRNEVIERLQVEEVSYNSSTGICAKVTLPTSAGGFWVREAGVYDKDGDLVIIAKQAPSYKPSLAEGANKDITIKIHSKEVNSSVVTLGIDASLNFLAISGGKMRGGIDMDNKEISNLPHYADAQAHKALFDATKALIVPPNYNTPYSITVGRCDANGNANVLSFSGNTIKLYASSATTLGITNHLHQTANIAQTLTKTIAIVASAATYNLFVGLDSSIDAFATPYTKGVVLPASPVLNQVHYLTATEPCVPKKWNGTTWDVYNKIPCGQAITNSSGVVTSVVQPVFNQNGYDINANTVKKYDSGLFRVDYAQTYTVMHNLGTSNIKYTVLIADDAFGTNQRPALGKWVYTTTNGYIPSRVTNTYLTIKTAGSYVGTDVDDNYLSSAYYRILAEAIN